MKIGKIIRKNWLFILFGLLMLICIMKKDQKLPMEIVSYSDTQVSLKNGEVLEQTWLSEVKEIAEIKVSGIAGNSFENKIYLTVLEADSLEVMAQAVQEIKAEKMEEKEIVFSLPKWECIQGNQYIFQMRFEEEKVNSELLLPAGTDYMGCSIDGVFQDKGVNLELTYVKNSRLFWLVFSLFPLIAFSFLFMVVWNRKWEETVGMSMALLIFVLFLFGLCNQLETGIVTAYVLSFVSMFGGIFLYNKKEKQLSDLCSVGLFLFVLLLGVILVMNKDARFARWDEFSHWGLAAKDMFFSNSYAKHFDSTVIMKYYPPVTTLAEYFFCYTNKLFSPGMVYVGFQMLGLCLLSSGLGVYDNKKIWKNIVALCGMICLPVIFFYDAYNCIYVDPILAFGVMYVLMCYYTEKMCVFNFLRIVGGLFLLTLTKDTGVVLAGILTLVMLGDVLFKQWKESKWKLKQWELKKIAVPVFCTALVCIFFFSWQIYLSIPVEKQVQTTNVLVETEKAAQSENTEESMSVTGAIGTSKISLGGLLEIVTGDAPIYRYEVIRNYLTKIFSDTTYPFGQISLSYMDLLVMILAVAVVTAIFWKENKIGSFAVLTFIGGLGYCGFLLVTYLFAFSEVEARLVISYDRYAGGYLCGVLLAAINLMIVASNNRSKEKENAILIGLLAATIVVTPVENFYITNTDTQLRDDHVYGYEELANILQTDGKKGDKVYFVCSNSDGHAQLQFKSAVVPMQVEYGSYDIYGSKEIYWKQREIYDQNEIGAQNKYTILPLEKWEKRLKGYEYVVLFHTNEAFTEAYGSLFADVETIGDGTVYRVEKAGESVVLHYVGKTGIKSYR